MYFDPYIILMIPVFLFSLSFHEFAHALTANWGGDLTATYEGRLTLNPLAHIDPIGTIVVPLIAAITGLPLFGWAKPVNVAEENFRRRNWSVVVSLAGPGSNFVLVLFTAIILKILVQVFPRIPSSVELLGSLMVQINLVLMLFNLIPIPPLDGSHVLWHLVIKGRTHLYPLFHVMAQYGIFILMALFLVPQTKAAFAWAITQLWFLVHRFVIA